MSNPICAMFPVLRIKFNMHLPGGPCRRYPLLYGISLSLYHLEFEMNSSISDTILSFCPCLSITDFNDLLSFAFPNCLQSLEPEFGET